MKLVNSLQLLLFYCPVKVNRFVSVSGSNGANSVKSCTPVSRLTVCPYALHLLISITSANQGCINQRRCQAGEGQRKCWALLPSITPAVHRHPASDVSSLPHGQKSSERFCPDRLAQFVSIAVL